MREETTWARKARGDRAEAMIKYELQRRGWFVIGEPQLPGIDLLAAHPRQLRRLAVSVKFRRFGPTESPTVEIMRPQLTLIENMSGMFAAEPYVGVVWERAAEGGLFLVGVKDAVSLNGGLRKWGLYVSVDAKHRASYGTAQSYMGSE
jgi:hypothetical protein